MALTLTEVNFEDLVLKSSSPVLVDFRADWCSSCRMLDPVIESLYKIYEGKAVIGKVDVDVSPGIAKQYGLQHVPALLFFKNGQIVDRYTGAAPQNFLTEVLDKQLT